MTKQTGLQRAGFAVTFIAGFTQTFATTNRQTIEKISIHPDRIMTEGTCEWVVIRADDPLERVWLLRLCLEFGRHWFGLCVLGLCSVGQRAALLLSPAPLPWALVSITVSPRYLTCHVACHWKF